MTDYEKRVQELLYSSECCKFVASKTECPVSKTKLLMRSQEFIERANNLNKDYKKPEFKMPEWGTYGT
jgi:hypothetical protein